MVRYCRDCGNVIPRNHLGNICFPCLEKHEWFVDLDDLVIIDAEQYARLLGLDSVDQLKRLARQGVLAVRVPIVKEWKWYLKDVLDWIKQEQSEETKARQRARNRKSRRYTQLIASNLRRLSNDKFVQPFFDHPVFDDVVFGERPYNGTTADFRIDEIQLPKIPKKAANEILFHLPHKGFPELEGVDDWNKLPLDRITEDFLVRLETYF